MFTFSIRRNHVFGEDPMLCLHGSAVRVFVDLNESYVRNFTEEEPYEIPYTEEVPYEELLDGNPILFDHPVIIPKRVVAKSWDSCKVDPYQL